LVAFVADPYRCRSVSAPVWSFPSAMRTRSSATTRSWSPDSGSEYSRHSASESLPSVSCSRGHLTPAALAQARVLQFIHPFFTLSFCKSAGPVLVWIPDQQWEYSAIELSPPYMHDGRCLTLEDKVEFFNIVLQLKLAPQKKADLVAVPRRSARIGLRHLAISFCLKPRPLL
jgi:hypothetical protein